jgi:hypothetical protein
MKVYHVRGLHETSIGKLVSVTAGHRFILQVSQSFEVRETLVLTRVAQPGCTRSAAGPSGPIGYSQAHSHCGRQHANGLLSEAPPSDSNTNLCSTFQPGFDVGSSSYTPLLSAARAQYGHSGGQLRWAPDAVDDLWNRGSSKYTQHGAITAVPVWLIERRLYVWCSAV